MKISEGNDRVINGNGPENGLSDDEKKFIKLVVIHEEKLYYILKLILK